MIPSGEKRSRGLGYVVSPDGGRSFSRPASVPDSADPLGFNGGHQGQLMRKMALSPGGSFGIANSALVQDERSRVWLILGKITEGR